MAVARFWRNQDQRYNLTGSECGVCGRKFFPDKTMCPVCHRRSIGKMRPYRFAGKGTIESFTLVHAGMQHFKSQVPYILAYIRLEEGDHVLGQLVDCDISDISIGKKVEMVFRKISEEGKSGTIQYGYKFRLSD